ncbi:MAG TPA: carboxypeptidase regulatory-like domain-containing protein [Thermoanaerobaculia bacterium]|nr:carboxypeptidase regulatory-like domain-containing protein [Thermoanaerobaculia bacterium]
MPIPWLLACLAIAAALLPAGALIEGQVTDMRGVPIEAASIWFGDASIMEVLGDPSIRTEPTAKTTADGRFRLIGLPAGARVDLRIEHAGYVPLKVPGVEAPTREALHVEMKTARGLAGRVIGPDREPVADATLTQGGMTLMDPGLSLSRRPVLARTDPQGTFRIAGLEPGPADLRVAAQGYATQTVHGIPIPQDRDLEGFEIVLEHGTVLEVRLLSAEGTPVVGAIVAAMPEDPRTLTFADLDQTDYLSGSTTDKRGIVLLTVPRPAPWRVTASMQGRSVAALVQAGQGTTPVELRFPSGAEVSGRVTDPQGRGIGNATVELTAEPNAPRSTFTREDGAFVFQQVPDGIVRLTARRLGFVQSVEPREVAIAGSGVRDLGIQLEPKAGITLTGRLIGLKTSEIQAAMVQAFGDQGLATATVGPDGRYEVRDLQPGDWIVQVTVGNRAPKQQTTQIQAGDSSPVLDIDFSQGFTLTGRVAMDGKPLSGALVQVVSRAAGNDSAQTNFEGRFQVRNLAAGQYVALVFATRGITGYGQPVDVEGDTDVTIDIPVGVLRGRVVSAVSGEPIPGATVNITPQTQGSQIPPAFSIAAIRSGVDGHFESRLADGTYQILVQMDGYTPAEATAEVRADAAGAPVEIRLKPAGPP